MQFFSMKKLYFYTTKKGARITFFIAQQEHRFFAFYWEEEIGCYESPEEAAKALAKGHCDPCDAGDTNELGIPENLSEWSKL
jgi:hypothetical protein